MIKETLKNAMLGRNVEFFDNLIFLLSNRQLNVWAIANKLKNKMLGKSKVVSDERIIVVGGCPRSGTTLLQMLLKVHGSIDGPYGEICLFEDVQKFQKISDEFDIPVPEVMGMWDESNNDVVVFCNKLFDLYKANKEIDRPVLKAPKSIFIVEDLLKYYPNMQFLHIIRDGRDASVSIQKYFLKRVGKVFPFSYGAKTWVVSINEGKKLRKYKNNYMEIKYEDLVASPGEAMVDVFNFLGINDYDIEKVVNYNQHINPQKVFTHEQQISKPINNAAIARWKKEMDEKQQQQFMKIGKPELIELGYSLD